MLPALKDHRARQCSDILEKGLASGQHLAQQGICVIAPRQNGMKKTCQEIEAEQKRREVFLPGATVLRDMIALGLEDMVVFMFDFPPPPPRLGSVGPVGLREGMSGENAVVGELFARFGMGRGALDPIDRQGPCATAEDDVIARAIDRDGCAAAVPAMSCHRGDGRRVLPKGHALIARGRRIGLAHTEEVAALLSSQRAQGLVAGEVVAQEGDAMRRDRLGVCVNPAFAGHPLAILFFMTVLGPEACGGDGQHFGASRAHDHWGEGAMSIKRLPL